MLYGKLSAPRKAKKSMAFGGGLAVWFFLASAIGLFARKNMVTTARGR